MIESLIISAASAIISSAINNIATLVRNEINFLRDVPAKVLLIEAKLRIIQSYLKDAENKPQRSHMTTNWLHELKGVTYSVQDVIEKILWLRRRHNRARGCTGALSRYIQIPGYLKELHKIGSEIDRINSFIPGISNEINNLGVVNLGESSSIADQFEETTIHIDEEDEMVGDGFGNEITEIIKELLNPAYKPLSVISLIGMGGIGKTTIAKKVSNDSAVQKHFDIIASITVSKEYNVPNLQKEILKATQIKEEELEKISEGEVKDKLYGHLKEKKYLIVIDNIWKTKFWDEINPHNTTFPNINNGSRIILTTRKLKVAKCPEVRNYIHKIKSLDDDTSWGLLKKKAFPPYVMVSDELRNKLESLGSRLVRKCNGLPLALIVLGSYLSKHLDYPTWSTMAEAVDWDKAGKKINISKILALSYDDLPKLLKPAFLYITAYPDDQIIESFDLIRLWIAEGFIPPDQKYKLEKIAQIYLDQLNERSLVQVIERSTTRGWITKIRIHDVLRDWGMRTAKKEGFFHVIKYSGGAIEAQIPYRVALHGHCDEDIATSMRNLRTILGFELPTQNVSFRGLNSLRVVSLMQREGTNKLPKYIKHMIFLRYICLRHCSSVYFPSAIGDLSNLQTLDCRESNIFSIPSSLWEISTLRHVWLEAVCCNWNGPKKGSGKNIQTLTIIDISKNYVGLVQTSTAWMYTGMDRVAATVKEMEHMVHLHLSFDRSSLPRNLLSKISGLLYLEVLELHEPIKGLTRIPAANAFPPNIVKLELSCEDFVEDPMPVLQELPELVHLYLMDGLKLKSMHCSADGFLQLKFLCLFNFPILEDWKVDAGAMPSLCDLKLFECENLEKFPEELMELDQLQLVELENVPHLHDVDYSKLKEKDCEVIIRN